MQACGERRSVIAGPRQQTSLAPGGGGGSKSRRVAGVLCAAGWWSIKISVHHSLLETTGPHSIFLSLLLAVVYASSWLWSFLPAVGFALSDCGKYVPLLL